MKKIWCRLCKSTQVKIYWRDKSVSESGGQGIGPSIDLFIVWNNNHLIIAI